MNCEESGEDLDRCWTSYKKSKENKMSLGCFRASIFRVAIYKVIAFYKSLFPKPLLRGGVLSERLCDVNYSHRNLKNQA